MSYLFVWVDCKKALLTPPGKTSQNFPGPAMTRLGPDLDQTMTRLWPDYDKTMPRLWQDYDYDYDYDYDMAMTNYGDHSRCFLLFSDKKYHFLTGWGFPCIVSFRSVWNNKNYFKIQFQPDNPEF